MGTERGKESQKKERGQKVIPLEKFLWLFQGKNFL